jgi:CBS-domain-containing membrane protein
MQETIRDSMTVAFHSPQSGSDEDAGNVPRVKGEIHVGSVILSEIAGRELVTVDPQQDLDGVQRLQARHQVRRRPVVEASDEVIGSVVQTVVAVHASAKRRRGAVEGTSR